MKWNFVSGVVAVKRPIKKVKKKQKTEEDIESSMMEATRQAYIGEVLRYTFL